MKTKRIRFLYAFTYTVILFMVATPTIVYAKNTNYQQDNQITIKGVIKDASGETLPGVSVTIKGTTTGTMTGIDGEYSIGVPNNSTVLVASYLGYESQDITVGNRTNIDFTLQEANTELNEVVVVGYGVQKKVNLTGAVSSIKSEKIANRPATNLTSTLAGLAPGVQVTMSSGNPGADNASSIKIRGTGSINASAPLVLIDGVEGDMSTLNSDDIESVNFLKDAASAAIYGSRAASGVILITTKKGRQEKPRITFSSLFGVDKAKTSLSFLSRTADWMTLHNESVINATPTASASSLRYPTATIDSWREADANPNGTYTDPATGTTIPNWLAYPNTDWATEMFKSNFYQRYSLSVSGGTEVSSYLLSASYQNSPGALENTGLERYNVRANVETKVKDFLTIGTQTYGVKEFKDPGNTEMTYLLQGVPTINPKHNGLYGTSEDPNLTNVNNILASIANNEGQIERTRINTNWYAIAKIWKGLSAEARFNYSEYQLQENSHSANLAQYRFRQGTETPAVPSVTIDQATTARYSYMDRSYTANLMLRYNQTFGDHDISAFAAYEQYYRTTTGFRLSVKGMLDWDASDINAGSSANSWGTDKEKSIASKKELGILSYFGRVNYAYKSRYLLEANLRSDASSRYAPGHRWGTFPSFSAGWRISEESFFEPLKDQINSLKLKASYGVLGNQILGYYDTNSKRYIGYYDWQMLYSKVNTVLNESAQSGIVQSQLANYDLTWEKTASTNLGFEAGFLNQRLQVEFDYFFRKTKNMLVSPDLYLTLGNVTSPKFNSAEMNSNGLEMNIGWNDKIGNVRYSVTANATYMTNKVTKFNGALNYEADPSVLDRWGNPTWRYTNLSQASNTGTVDGTNTRIVEGHKANEFFMRKPYKGDESYYLSDGKVNPNGGPKSGIIRTKADLDWVRAMIADGYSFNNKTVGPGAANLWYGEMIMADENGDGNYGNDDDRVFTGKSPDPKWLLGLNMSAEWKGFDLNMSWAGSFGGYAYIRERGVNKSELVTNVDALPSDAMGLFYSYNATLAATDPNYDPATDPTANINARYPRLVSATSTMVENTGYLYNSSYFKLKSLQIGYTLPSKVVKNAGISNVRFFVSGENLLTIKSKNFPGVDPELGNSIKVYPLSRVFSGGFSFSF